MQENPQEEQAEPVEGEQEGGGVKELMIGINNNLLKFKEILSSASQIPDEVKTQLDAVIDSYKGFVQALAQAAGGQPQGEPPAGESQPVEGRKPSMKGPMPVSGGSNVRPAM